MKPNSNSASNTLSITASTALSGIESSGDSPATATEEATRAVERAIDYLGIYNDTDDADDSLSNDQEFRAKSSGHHSFSPSISNTQFIPNKSTIPSSISMNSSFLVNSTSSPINVSGISTSMINSTVSSALSSSVPDATTSPFAQNLSRVNSKSRFGGLDRSNTLNRSNKSALFSDQPYNPISQSPSSPSSSRNRSYSMNSKDYMAYNANNTGISTPNEVVQQNRFSADIFGSESSTSRIGRAATVGSDRSNLLPGSPGSKINIGASEGGARSYFRPMFDTSPEPSLSRKATTLSMQESLLGSDSYRNKGFPLQYSSGQSNSQSNSYKDINTSLIGGNTNVNSNAFLPEYPYIFNTGNGVPLQVEFYTPNLGITMGLSKTLYIANIQLALFSANDLLIIFSMYGPLESLHPVPENDAVYITFVNIEDSVRCKDTVYGSTTGNLAVVSNLGSDADVYIGASSPISPAIYIDNFPLSTISHSQLQTLLSKFGALDSFQVLSHKDGILAIYWNIEDAINAQQTLDNTEIIPGTGSIVTVGFAKYPLQQKGIQSGQSPRQVKYGNYYGEIDDFDFSDYPSYRPHTPLSNRLDSRNGSPQNLGQSYQHLNYDGSNGRNIPTNHLGFNQGSVSSGITPYISSSSHADITSYSGNQLSNGSSNIGGLKRLMSVGSGGIDNQFNGTISDLHMTNAAKNGIPMRTKTVSAMPTSSISAGKLLEGNNGGRIMFSNSSNSILENQYPNHPNPNVVFAGLGNNKYATNIPPVPEGRYQRRVDQNRLREFRKRLESSNINHKEVEMILIEILPEILDLCVDHAGNVVVQKIVEKGDDVVRLKVMESVKVYMAAIGIHKNGTWVVQKLIDYAKTVEQMQCISEALTPYTPPLLLDQYGNYVVQCCLRFGHPMNLFIFDTICARMTSVVFGRFGARATRACLESPYTPRKQQRRVAQVIVDCAPQLVPNANGTILITWLLEASQLTGRYTAISHAIISKIGDFSAHKLAGTTLIKLCIQSHENDAKLLILESIFSKPNLRQIVIDHHHGFGLLYKIIVALRAAYNPTADSDAKARAALEIELDPDIDGTDGPLDVAVTTTSIHRSNSVAFRPNDEASPLATVTNTKPKIEDIEVLISKFIVSIKAVLTEYAHHIVIKDDQIVSNGLRKLLDEIDIPEADIIKIALEKQAQQHEISLSTGNTLSVSSNEPTSGISSRNNSVKGSNPARNGSVKRKNTNGKNSHRKGGSIDAASKLISNLSDLKISPNEP